MFKKKETTIGFNMTERRITIVECNVGPKGISVLKSAHGEIPSGYIHKGEIIDFDSLLAFSYEVVDEIKPQSKFASFNLPTGTYIIKRMPLREDYIATNPELIKWEMRHHLIAPVENYAFSHYHAHGNSYFIAVHKRVLEQRLELINGIGFVPLAADPSSIILHNIYNYLEDDVQNLGTTVLFDLSVPYSSIGLIKDGVFYPGGGFVTDPAIFLSAFLDGRSPGNINIFKDDIKAHFEMVYSNLGIELGKTPIDALVFSGGRPSSQVAIQVEQVFNSSIYLAHDMRKHKKISLKGKLHNLSFSELASGIGLALRTPHE